MSEGTYTVTEAAKVLQRSPKRVRQMIREGKLVALPDMEPQRVGAQAVHDLRDTLRAQGTRPGPAPQPTGLTFEQVLTLVDTLTTKAIEAAASDRAAADRARDDAEEALRNALAEERAKTVTLQAQLEAAEAKRRKWWGR